MGIDPLTPRGKLIEASLVTVVLIAGLAIRLLYLDEHPFWVDEAESSINALTILEHGYPTDTYLGIPIYENTLIRPWPESAEYEFRDLSYSDNHFAVYHGWLPLYAIAGSFAINGVAPDKVNGTRSIKYDLSERKHRTRAARLPAVFFGLLFLVLLFAGGKMLYGPDAAWAGLLVGSIYPYHLAISRQARYYSAEVALTTACAISLWLLIKYCKWKHVYVTAIASVLLFHTHLLSFAAAALVCLMFAPSIIRRHDTGLQKLVAFAALVAAGTLPWIIATEFYRLPTRAPRAWPLLNLPTDFTRYPPVHPSSAVMGITIALLTALLALKPNLPERLALPAKRLGPILLFLGIWAACAYVMFMLFVPAVSLDRDRLNLSYWGPLFLLASLISAAIARVLAPRRSVWLAPVIMLMIFFVMGRRPYFHQPSGSGNWNADQIVLNQIAATPMDSTTKLYAAPNNHLILTFYSGLPVQDITPVRKSYLNSYRGSIVYIDDAIDVDAIDADILTPEKVRTAARRDGYRLSAQEAETWTILLRTRDYREAMLKSLSTGTPEEIEPIPPFGRQLLASYRSNLRSMFSSLTLDPAATGFPINSWSDWRVLLKYRFVGPAAHAGIHANYAERLRGADVVILTQTGTAVYFSRWHPPDANDGIKFRFVQ